MAWTRKSSEPHFSAIAANAVSTDACTAVSSAGPVGTVDVTITTPGGTTPTTAADRFTFQQVCVVPKLKGKTLTVARAALKTDHCSLGKITGPQGKTARVKKQTPKPGKILRAGSKVSVTTSL